MLALIEVYLWDMIRNFFFFYCVAVIGACSTSQKSENLKKLETNEVKKSNQVCLNHSLLVLDSTTYKALVNSEFINLFAFSYEKQLPSYQGFYLIGETSYLEFFHPKSMEGEDLEKGEIWICLASLKANYLKELNSDKMSFIEYESDDSFNYLSLITKDSINPITTWEMKKKQYENWTKKKYHDSISFFPVDYNSPEESDSSFNYLMNDINGIGISLNQNDSLKVITYLKEIGYKSYSEFHGYPRISNNEQFIELHVSNDKKYPSINRYYIKLNEPIESTIENIGNSRIECEGKLAIWYFE